MEVTKEVRANPPLAGHLVELRGQRWDGSPGPTSRARGEVAQAKPLRTGAGNIEAGGRGVCGRRLQLEELRVKHDDKMKGKEKRINQLISMERYARKQKSRLEGT
jgi:hypothetical protein